MRQRILIGVAAAVFIAAIVAGLLLLFAEPKNNVVILRDGEVLYSLDLSQENDRTFVIPYALFQYYPLMLLRSVPTRPAYTPAG